MAEANVTLGTETPSGQAGEGTDGNQTTQAAPAAAGEGQPGAGQGQGTTTDGTQAPTEDTFFDPKSVDEALMPAYKNMQRGYSKKMEGVKAQQQKIDAYDAFMANPMQEMQRVAQQYGYTITQNGQPNGETNKNWEPQSWNEVMDRAEEHVMQKLQPLFGQFKDLRQQTIENQLGEIDPGWQQYEDTMKINLQKHPSLANDPTSLYRMSVPQEVLESRATQLALKKLEAKGESAKISGGSTTTKTPSGGLPDKPVSFAQAVEAAKQSLREQGITKGD